MKPLSEIVTATPASGIRKFFDVVSQMKDVVSLGVGEPDFVTPWRVRDASIYSLERGYTNYTSNYGLIELRRAVSDYLKQWEGLDYNPENEILITVGLVAAEIVGYIILINLFPILAGQPRSANAR